MKADAWCCYLVLRVQYNITLTDASYDVADSSRHSNASVRIHNLKRPRIDGATRFPKLDECAHFHYEFVELQQIEVCLISHICKTLLVIIITSALIHYWSS